MYARLARGPTWTKAALLAIILMIAAFSTQVVAAHGLGDGEGDPSAGANGRLIPGATYTTGGFALLVMPDGALNVSATNGPRNDLVLMVTTMKLTSLDQYANVSSFEWSVNVQNGDDGNGALVMDSVTAYTVQIGGGGHAFSIFPSVENVLNTSPTFAAWTIHDPTATLKSIPSNWMVLNPQSSNMVATTFAPTRAGDTGYAAMNPMIINLGQHTITGNFNGADFFNGDEAALKSLLSNANYGLAFNSG